MLTDVVLPKTTIAHHPSCPYEYAWDVAGEMGASCSCPRFYPRRVCVSCWEPIQSRHHKSRCKYGDKERKGGT